jgi:phytoene dehydrogenase-like protein
MLLGLDRQLPGLSHHSAYFSDDYDEEFRQLFVERRFPDDPTVYVNAPGRTDRSVCPPGGENLFIMANAPANDPDRDPWDEAQCDEAERRVFERLRRSGFPDIQDHVVARSVWSPRRIADRYDMPGGALYGAYSHGWRNAFFRPPNKNKTTAGLYHVGGSVQPGGGAPTVLMSARITEDLIKRHEQ